ncbi:MAG: DJ-1/PfpI family protein [Mogibacterium sp.]|nr:DJ-1/PfpI family protein [Mogibacterium sp.]MBR0340856.1 DJ-1/PfpI family protein [Oscillospiraceae bacterium]
MKAIVFLADGFEECEGLIAVDILRRAGIETIMASAMEGLEIDSSRHIKVQADVMAGDVDFSDVDLIVLPGGRLGTENLGANSLVAEKCREFAADKYAAAICAAPSLFAALGLLEGKKATCHPDFEGVMYGAILTGESVVKDGNVITGQGLGASFDFAFELVRVLVGEEMVEQIKKAICYRVN